MSNDGTGSSVGSGLDPLARKADEQQLIRRCLDNDRAAQRQLFHDHKRSVHATLYRILGSNRDVEDLIQEAFLQIFRSLGSFRHEAALSTWVSRITTRVAFAYIRGRPKRLPNATEQREVVSDAAATDDALAARQALASLYGVLERLDAKYRIAYALHVIDGKPLREVATMTEASVTAVKSQVWRARREVEKRAKRDPHLAQYLESQGGES